MKKAGNGEKATKKRRKTEKSRKRVVGRLKR